MRRSRLLGHALASAWSLAATAAVAACGPGPTGPAAPERKVDAGASPSEGARAGEPAGPRLAENRAAFLQTCAKDGEDTRAFCECAWGELRALVGDTKMGNEGPDGADLVNAHDAILLGCRAKVPERAVKQRFLTSCTGERGELAPYCECAWTELRKSMSPAELVDPATVTVRVEASRRAMTKACGDRIPEAVVKSGFLEACRRDVKLEAFCGCAWEQIRKLGTPAEIEAGLVPNDKVAPAVDEKCARLRSEK